MPVSAAIIVRNEEAMLKRCLSSLSGIDEIVIVDTGSEDSTIDIAKQFTKKVFTTKWEDDFSKVRNLAASHCSNEWILVIDADEYLEKGGVGKIKSLIEKHSDKVGITARIDHSSKEVGDQIRLYKKDKARYYDECHNWLGVTSGNQVVPLGYLPEFVYTSGITIYSDHSPAHAKDPDRTMRILQKMLDSRPKYARPMFYMAREYINRENYFAAGYWLKKYTAIAPETNELAEAYYLLGSLELMNKDFTSARSNYFKCVELVPTMRQGWEALSSLYAEKSKERGMFMRMANAADNSNTLFIRK